MWLKLHKYLCINNPEIVDFFQIKLKLYIVRIWTENVFSTILEFLSENRFWSADSIATLDVV